MKTLISVSEVKKAVTNQEKTIHIPPDAIITPAARDAARDNGIAIVVGSVAAASKQPLPLGGLTETSTNELALIAKIVGEVMARLRSNEEDSSGLQLVRGDSVILEDVANGGAPGRIRRKEIICGDDAGRPAAGFMALEASSFSRASKCDELCYIIEGTLTCVVNDRECIGKAGDVFSIPAHAKVTFTTQDCGRWFFVTSPVNK